MTFWDTTTPVSSPVDVSERCQSNMIGCDKKPFLSTCDICKKDGKQQERSRRVTVKQSVHDEITFLQHLIDPI